MWREFVCTSVYLRVSPHCPPDNPQSEGSQAITQQLLKNKNKHTLMKDRKRIHLFVP